MDRHPNQHALAGSHGPEDLTADILIGRIVDGEALPVDRARFDDLAAVNPGLWKLLALRQQDAAALTARFEKQTDFVDAIDLPEATLPLRRAGGTPWWLAVSGWAAVIVVAVLWSLQHSTDARRRDGRRTTDTFDPTKVVSPDEYLRLYKTAPYVMGEWPPTLLTSEKLPDGRTFIRMLRRIEETAYLDADTPVPVGEDDRLTMPPDVIRKQQNHEGDDLSAVKPN